VSGRSIETVVKEHPIQMIDPMVVATLDGRKTQTRRVVKLGHPGTFNRSDTRGYDWTFRGTRRGGTRFGGNECWQDLRHSDVLELSPYGGPGDRLYVRERQRVIEIRNTDGGVPGYDAFTQVRVRYEADGAESGWIDYPDRLQGTPQVGKCLAYGGPRETSRLLLEVVSVRLERLQEISEGDAQAEGVDIGCSYIGTCNSSRCPAHSAGKTHREGFRELWDGLNAGRGYGWDANPWVWVVAFTPQGGAA